MGDAFFAHVGKNVKKVCQAEKLLYARAELDEPQFASGALAGHVNSHKGAQPHAVGAVQGGEVQNDKLAFGDQSGDLVAEEAADAGDEPAGAMEDGFLPLTFDLDGEGDGGGLSWHEGAP